MKTEMREKLFLLKLDEHFNPSDCAASSKNLLEVSNMKDFPQKSTRERRGQAVKRKKSL